MGASGSDSHRRSSTRRRRDSGTTEFRQRRYAAQATGPTRDQIDHGAVMRRHEQAAVAAWAGIQPTGTYRAPLTRVTYNTPTPPDRAQPPRPEGHENA